MRQRFIAYLIGLVLIPVCSCSHNGSKNDLQNAENRILPQEDGTYSLKLDKAACYNDVTDPSGNTAEWKIFISKPGRFKVWLSSATKDTTDLHYANSVRISMLDKQFEVVPACDKIIHASGEYPASYFRADSYMGSFFVSEPGDYTIQVISEKVVAKNTMASSNLTADDTMLMSVFLTPMNR